MDARRARQGGLSANLRRRSAGVRIYFLLCDRTPDTRRLARRSDPDALLFRRSSEAYLSGQLDLAGDQTGQVLPADLQAIPEVLRLLRHNPGCCQTR